MPAIKKFSTYLEYRVWLRSSPWIKPLSITDFYRSPWYAKSPWYGGDQVSPSISPVVQKTVSPSLRLGKSVPPWSRFKDTDRDGIPDRLDPDPYNPNIPKRNMGSPFGGIDGNPNTPW